MQHLMDLAQETLLGPIQQVLASAREHGKLRVMEDRSIVYLFLVMIEALHDLPSCPDDAETVVSLFLDGIYLEAI
jgi:hypothetical protein